MTKEEKEIISKSMNIPLKIVNRLDRDLWYHGTSIENSESIIDNGVIANFNIGSSLDFGSGFYMTDSLESANNYISRVPIVMENGEMSQRKSWCVIEFSFNPLSIIINNPEVNYCMFPKHDESFARFVLDNRCNNVYNEKPHRYDIIWGVMSDNRPDEVVLSYKDGSISYEEAIEKLQKPNSMKQLFVGNQSLCDMLQVVSIIKGGVLDENSNIRE